MFHDDKPIYITKEDVLNELRFLDEIILSLQRSSEIIIINEAARIFRNEISESNCDIEIWLSQRIYEQILLADEYGEAFESGQRYIGFMFNSEKLHRKGLRDKYIKFYNGKYVPKPEYERIGCYSVEIISERQIIEF